MSDSFTLTDSLLPPLADYLAEQDVLPKNLRVALDTWLDQAHELLHGVDSFADPYNFLAESDRIQAVRAFRSALSGL